MVQARLYTLEENPLALQVFDAAPEPEIADEAIFGRLRDQESTPGRRIWYDGWTHMNLVAAIEYEQEPVGYIYIQTSLAALYQTGLAYSLIASVSLLVAFGLAVLISMRMQKVITKPFAELLNVTRAVAKDQDFSIRAEKNQPRRNRRSRGWLQRHAGADRAAR